MAGDWIKMRTNLADDPAVIGIADALNLDEDTVVGKLHRLWSWADSQSRDGHAASVTKKWVDRYVRADGFADAMISVGWMIVDKSGVTLPNFDRHNGKTAKTRALSSDRQSRKRHGDVTDGSRDERDKNVTREEKRREEKSKIKNGAAAPVQIPIDPKAALWARWKALPDGGGGAFLAKQVRDFRDEQRVLEAVERTLDHAPADPKSFLIGVLREKREVVHAASEYADGVIL